MESQSISLGDLFSVELFVGSITFVLGTVVFLLLLLKLRLNLKTTLLYCCLQLVLAVSLSTIFFMFWRFNFDIMIGFLYLPGVLSEVFIMLLFYFILKQRTNNWIIFLSHFYYSGCSYFLFFYRVLTIMEILAPSGVMKV